MGRNVVDEVADLGDMDEAVSRLPDEVRVALADIAEAAREGLLALSVSCGMAVLAEMMETERTVLCGPIHANDPDRVATRGGTTPTSVVLGSRRVPIRRPRAHRTDGSGEVESETFTTMNDSDLLGAVAMERMLAGLATRRYRSANEPVGRKVEAESSSMSKSSGASA